MFLPGHNSPSEIGKSTRRGTRREGIQSAMGQPHTGHLDEPVSSPSFGSSATADIDNDGYLEIVFGTYFNDETIHALNAEDGTQLWSYDTGGCNDASPVIYDVDQDADLEVVIPASSPCIVYCFDGSTGNIEWSTSTYPYCIDSPPAISDVDNDGRPEIVFGAF